MLRAMLREDKLPLVIESPCLQLPGVHPQNIVNRCQNQGVQIELSIPLSQSILKNPDMKIRLANVLRKYLENP
jgi:phage replication-related protein YjqB (UPF0714/DUF867 family)